MGVDVRHLLGILHPLPMCVSDTFAHRIWKTNELITPFIAMLPGYSANSRVFLNLRKTMQDISDV